MSLLQVLRKRVRRGARSGRTRGAARRERAAAAHRTATRASEAPGRVAFALRARLLFGALLLAALGLVGRAVDLQLVDHPFLASQGDARFSRVAAIVAHRGNINDRNGEPLAVSTPVDSVWVDPQELAGNLEQLPRLASVLGGDRQALLRHVSSNMDREFLYVARGVQPSDAARVKALNLQGVNLTREYRRYYPAGEVTGHALGFTSIDDVGQEGAELEFDNWLAGEDGAKRVIQDSRGRKVEDVESIRPVRAGRDLALSLDLRIQYLAYRELKSAIIENRAHAGSVVVIDIETGEVLAMVNQPAYNPNDRSQLTPATYRNRAVTDLFEPGSSIKPFVVAAGLASGKFNINSIIDTNPGFIQVGSTGDRAGQIIQRGHGQAGIAAGAEADLGDAQPLRLWPGHQQRLSGRIGRCVYRLFALARDQHRDPFARLWNLSDGNAARTGLRRGGRGLRAAAGIAAASRQRAGWRARPRCFGLP
jgi:cell division protein FtsI/penicillin-binding protein 2